MQGSTATRVPTPLVHAGPDSITVPAISWPRTNGNAPNDLSVGAVSYTHLMKDMIIVRGQNYYPQDIETVVEEASDLIRRTCVVAFEIAEDHGPALAVVAEVKNRISLPNPRDIAGAIRKHLNLEVALIALVAPRTVPKTSSGKIIRYLTRQMWLDGKFQVLHQFSRKADAEDRPADSASFSPFHFSVSYTHLDVYKRQL